jgi:hypothetical protein
MTTASARLALHVITPEFKDEVQWRLRMLHVQAHPVAMRFTERNENPLKRATSVFA